MAAVVGFLVLSFAIWGIGDVFRGFGRSTVAKIGHTEITIEQFRQIYNDRLQQFGRQLGRQLTMDQARALGIDRQVVAQLVAEVVLDEQVTQPASRACPTPRSPSASPPIPPSRRRAVSSTACASSRPSGRPASPSSDSSRNSVSRYCGASSRAPSLAARSRPKPRSKPQTAITTSSALSIMCCSIAARPARSRPPTPEELAKYFEERKILFRAPEYRKMVVVSLIPSEQARWVEVSDEDLKRAYDDRRSRYITPERRNIQQIVFPNADDARAAAERIAKGETFAAIAAERGLSDKDIDLGTVRQIRHHRPRCRRCRLRAQGGRSQRAGAGPFRHGARARQQDRARNGALVRRSIARAQAGYRDRARQDADHGALRQDRR